MNEKHVDVLVFDGCPNIDVALERARAAVVIAKIPADVRLVHVENDNEAKRLRFLGSPTVRVDGIDIDPTAKNRNDFALQCRVYAVRGRLEGAPPVEWIAGALRGEDARDATSVDRCAPCGETGASTATGGRR